MLSTNVIGEIYFGLSLSLSLRPTQSQTHSLLIDRLAGVLPSGSGSIMGLDLRHERAFRLQVSAVDLLRYGDSDSRQTAGWRFRAQHETVTKLPTRRNGGLGYRSHTGESAVPQRQFAGRELADMTCTCRCRRRWQFVETQKFSDGASLSSVSVLAALARPIYYLFRST